jgi:two-component system CheB/CheR fusion protein
VDRDLRASEIKAIQWRAGDSDRIFDIRITPLSSGGVTIGTSVAYIDVTEAHKLQDQLTGSKRELEQAYDALQSTVEELETSNEELETMNEELQSSNEELETMNEELQSSNEELETMNEELRHRTRELGDVNSILETILTSIGVAVAVLDRNERVQIWNGKAQELWGLTAEEAEDENLMSLDIGLPVENVRQQMRDTLAGRSQREELVLEATKRRGEGFMCRVTFLPLGSTGDGSVSGVIMMTEDVAA